MKTTLNNLYHDSMRKFYNFLFEIALRMSSRLQMKCIQHDVKHINTKEDIEHRMNWLENFEKKYSFEESNDDGCLENNEVILQKELDDSESVENIIGD